jgi:hypothetical protein
VTNVWLSKKREQLPLEGVVGIIPMDRPTKLYFSERPDHLSTGFRHCDHLAPQFQVRQTSRVHEPFQRLVLGTCPCKMGEKWVKITAKCCSDTVTTWRHSSRSGTALYCNTSLNRGCSFQPCISLFRWKWWVSSLWTDPPGYTSQRDQTT